MSLVHRRSSAGSLNQLPQRPPITSGEDAETPLRRRSSAGYQTMFDSNGGQNNRRRSSNGLDTTTGKNGDLGAPGLPHAVGAYEVTPRRRLAQVIIAIVYCLLGAGVIFGYAALKPVLIHENVYRELCTKEELEQDVEVCVNQEMQLNLCFAIGAVVTNVSALPVGTVLDRFGPKVTSIIGAAFLALGALSLSFADPIYPIDGYLLGYVLLALGGPPIFISSFQLSNAFPKYSGLILALLTGAFDTSSVVFLFYRLIYDGTDRVLKPRFFFALYLIVPIFVLLSQIFVMPSQSYKTIGEMIAEAEEDEEAEEQQQRDATGNVLATASSHHTREAIARRASRASAVSELLDKQAAEDEAARDEATRAASGVWGALHGLGAMQQIKTPWWILACMFTAVQMLRINYFVATIRPQYEVLLHSTSLAQHVNAVFDVALPAGGVVASPLVGLILDNTSTTLVLFLLVAIASIIGVLGLIESQLWAAYATIVLFVIYRPYFYTSISDYSAKVFGFNTFGKVYGLISCIAGLFNFIQNALDIATHTRFHDDPKPVNAILLAVGAVVGSAFVAYVWWKSYNLRRELLEAEAEGATEALLSQARQANGAGHDEEN